jgi:hypothetical protein
MVLAVREDMVAVGAGRGAMEVMAIAATMAASIEVDATSAVAPTKASVNLVAGMVATTIRVFTPMVRRFRWRQVVGAHPTMSSEAGCAARIPGSIFICDTIKVTDAQRKRPRGHRGPRRSVPN